MGEGIEGLNDKVINQDTERDDGEEEEERVEKAEEGH